MTTPTEADFHAPLAVRPEHSLSEQVTERLRRAIVTGHFSPAARLKERELTETLHVSRTPIREALRRLEHEGLVVAYPHRGYFVRSPSFEEAREAYEARRVIEAACAELAAERADELDILKMRQAVQRGGEALRIGDTASVLLQNNEFHRLQAHAARNAVLEKQWVAVWAFVDLLRGAWWGHTPRPAEGHLEHGALVDAIEQRNGSLARELASRHVERAWANVAKRFAQPQAEAPSTPEDKA
jgi:DNA-binding GntR family transcriptional regulator